MPFETEALHRSALVSIDRIEVRVLAIHRSRVDLPRVRARLAEFCGVLEDEERLRQFDSLVRRLP